MLFAQDVPDDEIVEAFDGVRTEDWLVAAAVVVGAIIVSRIVKRLTARVVARGDSERVAAQLVGRFLGILVVLVGLVYALNALGVRIAPLLGALGIGGLALAFAAQSILENLFASILLQSRRPFRRGDQIATTDGIEGTVEDVNFRTVVLRTYDGEKVLIPCSEVLNNPITNFTARGMRRTTLSVGVTYDTDLPLAQQTLVGAVGEVDGVRAEPTPEVWVERFGESSIDFAVRFWHAPDIASLWRVRSGVAMAIKAALDREGIEIPFPQRTLWWGGGAATIDVREDDGEAAGRAGGARPVAGPSSDAR